MKRNILTLLCCAFALCLLADEAQQYSIRGLSGAKIASVDAYDYIWNDSESSPTIIESDCAKMGKFCKLNAQSSTGDMILLSFYGDFQIPLHIDFATGVVTIKGGNKSIDALSNVVYTDPVTPSLEDRPNNETKESVHRNYCLNLIDDWPGSGPVASNWHFVPKTSWLLYAMPLSRVMGNDSSDTIHGQLNEDGTITFHDDFVFLVRQQVYGKNTYTWSMSPIYRNLKLLIPNGSHQFLYTHLTTESKLIDDRPEDQGPGGTGYGGLVPRPSKNKPGHSKPVPSFVSINGIGDNGLLGVSDPGDKTHSELGLKVNYRFGVLEQDVETTTQEQQPVYMCMADDTTLMVYNLFGQGNQCHLKINSDGTIDLPHQQIYNDGLGSELCNDPGTCVWSQDTLTWGKTTVTGEDLPVFRSNRLISMGNWPFVESPSFDVCVKRGDMNGDGNISITDAVNLINVLMNDDKDGLTHRANADVNQDGEISITDVVALINNLLSGK